MIILTGGAGFIGSCILAKLNALGHTDIWVVDHLNDPLKEQNLKGKAYSRYLDRTDFLKLILTNGILGPVEAVIHMGACSSTILQDAEYYESNNFQYTRHLAEWCLAHSCRFIYASSAATYGDGSQGYSDEDVVSRTLQPLNLYGHSKQKFDLWVLDNGYADRLVGLKFFNVFGPNEYHKGDMRSVVAKAYPGVRDKGVMKLFKSYHPDYADGEQRRDFIYVKDAVEVVMFFFHNSAVNGIYNVGTGEACSWNELARAIFRAVQRDVHIEYIDMPEYLRPRYQYFTQADMRKLRAAGFSRPFVSLQDAVADYVGYLKNQGHW